MLLLRTIAELRQWRATLPAGPGFVPTMGALHEGHASLVRRSAAENAQTAVSIFINPTQFGPKEDLTRYPRTLDADLKLCGQASAAAVFTPDKDMIYPPGFATWVSVEGLESTLEGRSRPGHFRGVCTVVAKLFNLVQPARAYFGQKDAQQALILTRMARELDMPVELITCPTVREADGLAMSSRNRYLSAEERQRALSLWRALSAVKAGFDGGEREVATLRAAGMADLQKGVDRVDYLEVVDAGDLSAIANVEKRALCVIAAFVGKTRLIDNLTLEV